MDTLDVKRQRAIEWMHSNGIDNIAERGREPPKGSDNVRSDGGTAARQPVVPSTDISESIVVKAIWNRVCYGII